MARRTKAEADETRTKLLDAAQEVFFEKGVSKTSLSDIAQRAGATRGAVYWHFKDKVDVFSSVLGRICMPFDDICSDKYGELPSLERMRLSIQVVFDSMEVGEQRRKVMDTALFKMEYVGELEQVRDRHIQSARTSQEKFAQDIASAAEELSVQLAMSPVIAAQGLYALFVGLIHSWVLDGGSFSLGVIGRMSVDAYLSGLGFKLDAPKAGEPLKTPISRPTPPHPTRQSPDEQAQSPQRHQVRPLCRRSARAQDRNAGRSAAGHCPAH